MCMLCDSKSFVVKLLAIHVFFSSIFVVYFDNLLPRIIMKRCRRCPAKLWSNTDFAPQNCGVMQTLPCKFMDPYSLPCKIIK